MYIYIYIYMYIHTKSRGVAYTGYNVPDNAEWEEKGEKRERYLFHHTTRSRSNCRCDLEPQGSTAGYTCSHRFWSVLCGPKMRSFGTAVSRQGKHPLWVTHSVMYRKKCGGDSSDDDAHALHQLAVALYTSVRTMFMIELGVDWALHSVGEVVLALVAALEVHFGHLGGEIISGSVSHLGISRSCSLCGRS